MIECFDPLVSRFGQHGLALLLIDAVVARTFFFSLSLQTRDQFVDCEIGVGRFLSRTRDNEWRASLIDQDGIHLIDDRVGQGSLHAILEPESEIIA